MKESKDIKNAQIGGGKITEEENTYTLINIHGPTAIWACILVGIAIVVAVGLRVLYLKRHRKMKSQINHHRALAWQANGYHRADCSKLDIDRECNCKPERGYAGHRCPAHCNEEEGRPIWNNSARA